MPDPMIEISAFEHKTTNNNKRLYIGFTYQTNCFRTVWQSPVKIRHTRFKLSRLEHINHIPVNVKIMWLTLTSQTTALLLNLPFACLSFYSIAMFYIKSHNKNKKYTTTCWFICFKSV